MNGNFDTVKQAIEKPGSLAIVVSARPNMDQMGGALALYLGLKDLGKDVSIISSQDPLVEVSNLVGVDKVRKSFESGQSGDLTVSFPYQEGEIEKISYTLENGFLNIVVKASAQGLTFNEKDILFKRTGSATPLVLFAVGVQKLSDLTPMFNLDSLKDTVIVNIDNSPDNQGFGEVSFVNPNASSVSEEVANLMLGLDLRIDIDGSQNILSGISFGTQNFSNPRTSALAFEMAAIMMRRGAKRAQKKDRPDRHNNSSPIQSFPNAPTQNQLSRLQQELKNRGNIQRENQRENNDTTPSGDWMEPKVFKGSTNVG